MNSEVNGFILFFILFYTFLVGFVCFNGINSKNTEYNTLSYSKDFQVDTTLNIEHHNEQDEKDEKNIIIQDNHGIININNGMINE